MISLLLTYTLYVSLAIFGLLFTYTVFRLWQGENSVDRLIGFDLISTLILGGLVLVSLIEENSIFIDAALGLAALSFIGVVAYAKYAADRRLF